LKSKLQKLVFVSHARIPGTSGDSTHHFEMIKKFAQKGLDVFLVCHRDSQSKIFDEKMRKLGIKVIRIPFIPPSLIDSANNSFVSNLMKLLSYYLVECCTVLFVTTKERIRDHVIVRCVPRTLPVSFVLRILRIDCMAELAELPMGTYIPNLGSGVKEVLLKIESKSLRSYTRFRVMAYEQLEYLVKLGIPREKIIVFPAGVNLQDMPKAINLSSLPPATFGFFGILEVHQGVDILIKAFSTVSKHFPNSKLYVIGNGTMKASLKQLAEELDLSSNIVFVNSVEREVLWREYFPKFRAVVIPRPKSIASALVPMKLIESLSAGKIVITTPIKSAEHIIESCAIIVPHSDINSLATAMINIIANENLQMELSRKSVEAASFFDIDKVADAILDVFKK
jgi:glycosyltransferase involved in cell wall biosynthesis